MPYQLRRWEGVHNEAVDRKAILCLKILLLVAVPTVLARCVGRVWTDGRSIYYP
jgi:hypothetical protein